MLQLVLDHMYPTGGELPLISILQEPTTALTLWPASRAYSQEKQHLVLKTKGHLVLLKTTVFSGRTRIPYCCNSSMPCSGGAQFSPQLVVGGWQCLHQNAVSGPPHPVWSRLWGGGVQRKGMCSEEEVCTQDVCTKMESTGAHICKETLSCWNPQGSWWMLCRGRKPAHFLEGTYVH